MPPKFESIKDRKPALKSDEDPSSPANQLSASVSGDSNNNTNNADDRKQDTEKRPTADEPQSPKSAASKPQFKLETIAVFTPHVKLVRRTQIDPATGQPKEGIPQQTFVRKTIGDPARAKRELEHLYAQCRHPNVLKYVSGIKHTNGTVDIDMEFADAGQLDQVLAKIQAGTDRIRAAKCCARQVLSGLLYYHEVHGRCHRDVKPANFLVRCDGIIKVSDFDVSKELSTNSSSAPHPAPSSSQQQSSSGATGNNNNNGGGGGISAAQQQQQQQNLRRATENTVTGTTGYMPPELILGSLNVSPSRSDMWSFGVTLFQLLEGVLPFAKFGLGNFTIPNNDQLSKLTWGVVKDDPCLEFLLRSSLVINPDDRLNLSEATAATFVIIDEPHNDDLNPWSNGYADPADENVVAAKELGVELCDEIVMACRTAPPKKVANLEDPSVKRVCLVYDPAEYAAIKIKIQTAAEAMRKELQSWRKVRENMANREKIDKAMKEVCRLRCEKTWKQLVAAAPWMSSS